MPPRRSGRIGARGEAQASHREHSTIDSIQGHARRAQRVIPVTTATAEASSVEQRQERFGQPQSNTFAFSWMQPYTEPVSEQTYQSLYGGVGHAYNIAFPGLGPSVGRSGGQDWAGDASSSMHEDSSQSFYTPASTLFEGSCSDPFYQTPTTDQRFGGLIDAEEASRLDLRPSHFDTQQRTDRLVLEARSNEDPARIHARLQTWYFPAEPESSAQPQTAPRQIGDQYVCEARGCSRTFDTQSEKLYVHSFIASQSWTTANTA